MKPFLSVLILALLLAQSVHAQTMRHHSARLGQTRVHYVRAGSGSPVLLLHGFPRTWRSWERVMPTLAKNHTLIVPDIPGMGASTRPASYDPRHLAEQMHALMRSLRLNQYAVVAHDLAGPVGYALAATHPEAVTRLALLETGIPAFGLEDAMNPAGNGTWHFGFFMAPTFPELLTTGRERQFMTAWMLRDEGPNVKKLPASVRPFFRAYTRPGALHNAFNWYRGLRAGRVQNAVLGRRPLRMPTLAIGADRSFGPFTFNNLRRVAPQTRGVIVPGRHFIHEDNPQAVLSHLAPFLNPNPTS